MNLTILKKSVIIIKITVIIYYYSFIISLNI